MILHERGKEILIISLAICTIVLTCWIGICAICSRYDSHIEEMGELGFERRVVYSPNQRHFKGWAWSKEDAPVIYQQLNEELCVQFLKERIRER